MFDESVILTLDNSKSKNKRYLYFGIKRLFDIIVSGTVLIALSPIFLIISILIKLDSKGTVFYKHKRIGKNGEYIYLYKFRTMYRDSNEKLAEMLKDPEIKEEWEANYKLDNDPRITRIGKFLRKTSIDELPQLINIFNGDMSIVGPRPVIDGEIEKYGALKKYFLSVTPGLTGWWAVNGRSSINYDQRKRLELYYITHQSIKLDIKIILKTFVTVFKRNNVK